MNQENNFLAFLWKLYKNNLKEACYDQYNLLSLIKSVLIFSDMDG